MVPGAGGPVWLIWSHGVFFGLNIKGVELLKNRNMVYDGGKIQSSLTEECVLVLSFTTLMSKFS